MIREKTDLEVSPAVDVPGEGKDVSQSLGSQLDVQDDIADVTDG